MNGQRWLVRYTLHERLCHWLAGFTYIYLLVSGLALYTPYFYWLAAVLGGGPTARFWHPWVGVLFTIGMLWMHDMWRTQMRTTPADLEWRKDVGKYIRNEDEELPPVDRFNPGQKQFYWVMLGGAIALMLSGMVMWFPEYVPREIRFLRSMAVFIHEVAALLTIGAFIIHVYMGVFVVPNGFRGIVTGTVTAEWARRHHRLWYERVAAPRE
jgi:formate dehydrogenase subunit gamma